MDFNLIADKKAVSSLDDPERKIVGKQIVRPNPSFSFLIFYFKGTKYVVSKDSKL